MFLNVSTYFRIRHNVRQAVKEGVVQVIPCYLHEIPSLFRHRIISIDIILLNVSEPDKNGYCSYGISCDITYSAVENARIIIAQVNKHVPFVAGDALIHISQIDYIVNSEEPIFSLNSMPVSIQESTIARHVANEIPDAATLQIGVGNIPNALLKAIEDHQHMGLHTEVMSDGAMQLIQQGVIDNSCKKVQTGKSISSLCYGSNDFYRYINNNYDILCKDIAWVNNPYMICKNPRVMAINSALEIDLSGQVCADSIGYNIYSGVGGQCDFARGSAMSEGGKSFIVLPSVTKTGASRIVPALKEGGGVTISRFQVQYVVTEFGIVNLKGKSLPQRARLLISIAAPEVQESLERQARERYGRCYMRYVD